MRLFNVKELLLSLLCAGLILIPCMTDSCNAEPNQFTPSKTIFVGYYDDPHDFEDGAFHTSVGTYLTNRRVKANVVVRIFGHPKHQSDADGTEKYEFTLLLFAKDWYPELIELDVPAGLDPPYPYLCGGRYTVRRDDVIMLPHGYLYQITDFVIKRDLGSAYEGGVLTGVELKLVDLDSSLYQGKRGNPDHLYFPLPGEGFFCYSRLKFETVTHDLGPYPKGTIGCLVSAYVSKYKKRYTLRPITDLSYVRVSPERELLIRDVGLDVIEVVAEDKAERRGGWIEVDPRPFPAFTPIPRSRKFLKAIGGQPVPE